METPLCSSYADLFSLATNRDTKVADVLVINDTKFLGILVSSEMLMIGNQQGLMTSFISCTWSLNKDSSFSVKSFYSALNNTHYLIFCGKGSGKSKSPPQSASLCGAAHNSILVNDNLKCRGMYLVDRCCLCLQDCETVNNLFLYCSFVS